MVDTVETQVWLDEGRSTLCGEVEPGERLPQPHNTKPSAKQVMVDCKRCKKWNLLPQVIQSVPSSRSKQDEWSWEEGKESRIHKVCSSSSSSSSCEKHKKLSSVQNSTESDQSDSEGPPRHQRRLPALSRWERSKETTTTTTTTTTAATTRSSSPLSEIQTRREI